MSAALSPEIAPPETAELKQESKALVTTAKAMKVTSHDEFKLAGAELVRVANIRKSIVFAFKEPKAKAHEAHKAITKLEADLLAYPMEAERLIKASMSRFALEDERRRREEEARERERLRKIEEDRVLAEASALEDGGDHQAAEELISQEVLAPVVEMPKAAADGVSSRRVFKYELLDINQVSRDFLVLDETKVRKTVNALGKDAAQLIGGIAVHEELVMAVRTN